MQHYEYQVSFFLNKKENEAFTKYCLSKNVAPYIAGRDIVRDFMMSTEDLPEQEILEKGVDALWDKWGKLQAEIFPEAS